MQKETEKQKNRKTEKTEKQENNVAQMMLSFIVQENWSWRLFIIDRGPAHDFKNNAKTYEDILKNEVNLKIYPK